jgi:riboflavin transporter FmnP
LDFKVDSRRIAILSIFAAMVIALEVLPVPLLTDIPLFAGFTLDPTGIPITLVFLLLGSLFGLILIPIMWISIAYRNLIGSVFKGFAEFYTLLGLIVAKLILRKRSYDWKVALPTYVVFGVIFRVVLMYISNIFLIQWLYMQPPEVALALSASFILPNLIQAFLNVFIGIIIFIAIPENLKIEGQLGKYGSEEFQMYEEISEDHEIVSDDD